MENGFSEFKSCTAQTLGTGCALVLQLGSKTSADLRVQVWGYQHGGRHLTFQSSEKWPIPGGKAQPSPSIRWVSYPPLYFRMNLREHLYNVTAKELKDCRENSCLGLSESGFQSRSSYRGFNPDGTISTFQYRKAVSPARLSSAHDGFSRMVFKSRGTALQRSLCRKYLREFEQERVMVCV